MVRVELEYNPYLLETVVRFNGEPPRINSLVEKYKNEKLQTWINLIPSIFHDEMNGYDFELLFSGTDKDYSELINSFSRAGVTKEQVLMFHKGELKSRYEKSMAIDDLLNWLKDHRVKFFDYGSFIETNRELFEGAYSLITVGGERISESIYDDFEVTVENVNSIAELRKTYLRSIPILMYLTPESLKTLRSDLRELLGRDDVDQNQVFFILHHGLNENIVRVIKDLGFHNPQVVKSFNDECVHSYLELFPVSEYIFEAIKVLKSKNEELKRYVEEHNQESEESNKEVYSEIKELDDIIDRLKASYDLFNNRDNLEFSEELTKEKKLLVDGLNSWCNKRTKITKLEDAVSASQWYDSEIKKLFHKFTSGVVRYRNKKCAEILDICEKWYQIAESTSDLAVHEIKMEELQQHTIPDLSEELLNIKDEQYVEPKQKDDFFGFFFKAPNPPSQEKVLETTYYYEKWRAYATQIIEPMAEQIIQETYEALKEYYDHLVETYLLQLYKLIQENNTEKQKVSNQLSEEERRLQDDNDWLTSFCDKLRNIERL